jgi:hypothetical protein
MGKRQLSVRALFFLPGNTSQIQYPKKQKLQRRGVSKWNKIIVSFQLINQSTLIK